MRHKSQTIITKYSFFLRSLSFHKKISQLMTTIRLCSSILRINTPLTTYAPKQEKYVNFNSKRTYRWCIKLFLVLSKMQENYRLLTPNHWAPRLTWGKKIVFLLWISRWVAASVVRPLRIRTRNDFGMMCFIFGSIHRLRRLSCPWRIIAEVLLAESLYLFTLCALWRVWELYELAIKFISINQGEQMLQ